MGIVGEHLLYLLYLSVIKLILKTKTLEGHQFTVRVYSVKS